MKLTISNAARVCRVARSTFQRAISAGRLSLDAEHQVDTVELLRSGYTLHDTRPAADRSTRQESLQAAAPRSSSALSDAAGLHQGDAALGAQALAALERENALLRSTLDAALVREQTHREELAWLRHHFDQMQQRYDRLLDAPRAPVPTPVPLPTAPPPGVVDVPTRMPAYHPDRHYLGTLCKRGHDWQGTGQSLRKRSSKGCLACDAAGLRARRQQRHP